MSLYQDLGVEPDSDAETIRRAYQRKARKNHPDKGGEVAEFQKIQRAYMVLRDPAKRARYDLGGDETPEPDVRVLALHQIAAMVLRLVEQAPDVATLDLLGEIKRRVIQARSAIRGQIQGLQEKRKKYAAAAKRIKRKRDGANMLAQMLEAEIGKIAHQLEGGETALAQNKMMLEIIGEYEYEKEKGPIDPFNSRIAFIQQYGDI